MAKCKCGCTDAMHDPTLEGLGHCLGCGHCESFRSEDAPDADDSPNIALRDGDACLILREDGGIELFVPNQSPEAKAAPRAMLAAALAGLCRSKKRCDEIVREFFRDDAEEESAAEPEEEDPDPSRCKTLVDRRLLN